MNPDFLMYVCVAIIGAVCYAVGRAHGRKAEKQDAAALTPMPSRGMHTQDGPPPKKPT